MTTSLPTESLRKRPRVLHFTTYQPLALKERESLTEYLRTPTVVPVKHTAETLSALSATERTAYDDARRLYLSGGIVIDTAPVTEGKKLLLRAIHENSGRNSGHTGVMLTGPAAVGKTTTAKALMRWVFEAYTRQFPDWEKSDHVPVVYVEVPPRSTEKSLLKEFAGFFGTPYLKGESASDLRVKIVSALRKATRN